EKADEVVCARSFCIAALAQGAWLARGVSGFGLARRLRGRGASQRQLVATFVGGLFEHAGEPIGVGSQRGVDWSRAAFAAAGGDTDNAPVRVDGGSARVAHAAAIAAYEFVRCDFGATLGSDAADLLIVQRQAHSCA